MPTRALEMIAAVSGVLGFIVAPLPAVGQQNARVPVIQVPSAAEFLSPLQWEARASAAKTFYDTHSDAYDFLVFVPLFPVDLSPQGQTNAEVAGRHYLVRNDVGGIGMPLSDLGGDFGSTARLRGVIELYSLVPGTKVSSEQAALVTMAHEVGHQWSSHVSFKDPTTGASQGTLLTTDRSHWSYFLDSDASVMYGADWLDTGGTFVSQGAQRRYSDLDLYLMGYLAPPEVAPITLIEPVAGLSVGADTLPPWDGAQVQGRAKTIRVEDIIAEEGPRIPDRTAAQQNYRAAFVILTDSAHAPTPEQLAFVDGLRRQWANQFFFMTRGRGVMETQLVESGGALATEPSARLGLQFLLVRQGSQGEWQDDAGTVIRDSAAALEALASYGADPAMVGARTAGASFLAGQTSTENDSRARIRLGLSASEGAPPALGLEGRNADGGYGLAPGYGSTPIDTALAALAATAGGSRLDPSIVDYLLASQRPDGGWGYLPGTGSSIEPTAWVLRALVSASSDPRVQIAADSGIAYIRALGGVDGAYADAPLPSPSSTAEAVLALDAWGALGSSAADQATAYLLSTQLADGSWNESVYETAIVVRALRLLLTPNLTIGDLTVSRTAVVDGEPVQVTAVVKNTARASAKSVRVRAYDSSGSAYGGDLLIPEVQGGQSVSGRLLLDTTGHAGSDLVFVVVDPDGAVDELRKDDNRAAGPLHVGPVPQLPDLYVVAGSLAASPPTVDTLPTHVQVTAIVGNLGLTSVASVAVAVYVRDQPVANVPVSLPGRSSAPVLLDVPIPAGPAPITLRLAIDPTNAIPEAAEDNNAASIQLPIVPSVDLAIASLVAAPATLEQGQSVTISYEIRNSGTLAATGASDLIRITTADGGVAALAESNDLTIPAGGSLSRSMTWRASAAGVLSLSVAASHPAERAPADNVGRATITVVPSSRPNLVVRAEDLTVTPDPALQGANAIAKLTVKNVGGTAAGPFHVAFFQGDTAHLVARSSVPGLSPGAGIVLDASYSVESDRELVVVAQADSDLEVDEYDESDNTVAKTITVLGSPDLVVDTGSIALSNAFPRQGEPVGVKITVRNEGGQPAGSATVALYDGAPERGGALVDMAGLGALAAAGSVDASFTWSPSSVGSHELVAIVTATGADARTDNNRASRSLSVQNVDLAITNPYFSPNGDGVKDTTEILYRVAPDAAVVANVYAPDGTVVVSLTSTSSGPGSIVWDGRDTGGWIVRDAKYRIAVRSSAASVSGQLGALDVVVDTNRSQLVDAIGTPLLSIENLDRFMPPYIGGFQDQEFAPLPDDRGLVQLACFPNQPCDFYVQEVGGGELTRLTDGHLPEGTIWSAAVSRDGSKLAFFSGWSSYSLWVYSIAEKTYRQVATGVWPDASPIFTADGNSIVYATTFWPPEIRLVQVDGSQDRLLAYGAINDFNVSPDGAVLSLEYQTDDYGGALRAQPLDGGPERVVATGYTPIDGGVFGYRNTPSHSWAPDGASIYFIGNLARSRWGDPYVPGIFRVPSAGGIPEMIAGTEAYADELSVSPTGDAIAFSIAGQILAEAPIGTEPRLLAQNCFMTSWGGQICPGYSSVGFSPQGSFMYAWDWGPSPGRRAFTTLANLTAKLVATRKPGDSFVTLEGTAVDAHFDRFVLEVRLAVGGAPFKTIASEVSPVVDGVFSRWTPPGNGVYEARITVSDKAGNVRSRSVRFGWAGDFAIANIARAPEFISPNADGVQDTTRISFTVRKPTSLEVQVADAAGTIVRRVPATYITTGDYAIDWDGLNDAGLLVPDGAYAIRIGDQSFPVVVDTVRPDVEVALGDSLAPSPDTEFGVLPVVGSPLLATMRQDAFPEGRDAFLNVVARAYDTNLAGWSVSEASNASELAIAAGYDTSTHEIPVPISVASGRSTRVVARDLAGNVARVDRISPERLYALGLAAAEGEALDPSVSLYGLALPGGIPYRNVVGAFFGVSPVSIPPGQEPAPAIGSALNDQAVCNQLVSHRPLTVFFANSIANPLASVSLAYRPVGVDQWTTAGLTPTLDVEEAAIWDTSSVSETDDLQVKLEAVDLMGRQFESPAFRVKCGPKPLLEGTCMSGDVLSLYYKSSTVPLGTRFALRLASVTSGAVTTVSPATKPAAGEFVVSSALPAPGCKYDVTVDIAMPDGGAFSTPVGRVDRCAAFVASRDAGGFVTIAETYPAGVQDVEVYAQSSGGTAARLAGRTGPFEGTSPVVRLDTSALGACSGTAPGYSLVTVLLDGTRIAEGGRSDRPLCPEIPLPCGSLVVDAPVPTLPEARCVSRPPLYSASVHGAVEGAFAELRARLVTPAGAPIRDVAVSGFTPGATIGATAGFSMDGLMDGPYFVVATARDTNGQTYIATSPAVIADLTPPVVRITAPAAATTFCASPAPSALTVNGSVADANLQRYTVWIRPAGGGTDVRTFSATAARTGTLATLDLGGLTPGDYLLGAEGRDLGGNATCPDEVPLRIPAQPSVANLAAAPPVFSPDGDGVLDGTTLTFSTRDVSNVTLALVSPSGARFPITVISQGSGDGLFAWDGRLADGSLALDGSYVLEADAPGLCTGNARATTTVLVDTTPPVARIDAPAPDATVSSAGAIIGAVGDPNLRGYQVSLGAGSVPSTFDLISSGDKPVVGTLGLLPLIGRPAGEYTVRIEAWDTAGHASEARVTFVWAPGRLIQAFNVSPSAVSPNGDGVKDVAVASIALASAAGLALDLVDLSGAVVAPISSADGVAGVQSVPLDRIWAGVPDGAYRVRASASSGAVQEEASSAIVVDRIAPAIAVSSPAVNAFVAGRATISAQIDDPHLSTWRVSRVVAASEEIVATGVGPAAGPIGVLAGLPDGPHTVKVTAEDTAGNRSERLVDFTSDATPPAVSLTSPLPGAFISSSSGPLMVTGNIVEAHLSRWRLEASRVANVWEPIADGATIPAAGVLALWDVATEPSGPVVLRLTAVDLAGNESSTTASVTIDNTPPVVAIATPRDAAQASVDQFIGTAADDNLMSWTLELSDGVPATAYRFVEVAHGTTAIVDGVLASVQGQMGEGAYTVRLRAIDRAGNEQSDSAGFFIDRTPPRPPPFLQVALQPKSDVVLTWQASPDVDVVGYRVMRSVGQGASVPVGPSLVRGTTWTDAGLRDGTYQYTVIAIDAASLESPPSPAATIEVDTTPPMAIIFRPAGGSAAHGFLDVVGTAFSDRDFKEYRLEVGAGAAPATFTLVRRSPAAVVAGTLGTYDTSSVSTGTTLTFRLEAEDLAGNIAEARTTILADNEPPAAPVLLSATVQSGDVSVTWQASSAPDVAGYLVYRDGVPVSVPAGADLSDPRPFLLPPGSTAWVDKGAPDGTFSYQVQAVDAAANSSALSNSKSVTIERRAPQATIVNPATLARVTGPFTIVADVVDQDVATVQIEVRAGGAANFVPVGSPLTTRPYVAALDPSTLSSPVMELRARATDQAGHIDAAPASTFAFFAPALDAPTVLPHVDGDSVSVAWQDANPPGRSVTFAVQRAGNVLAPTASSLSGAAAASYTYAGTPGAVQDGNNYSCWIAGYSSAYWQLTFTKPGLVSGIDVYSGGGTFDVLLNVQGVWVTVARQQRQVGSTPVHVSVGSPILASAFRVSYAATNQWNWLCEASAQSIVTSSAPPSEVVSTPGDLSLEYDVTAWGAFGQSAVGSARARVYAPTLTPVTGAVGDASFTAAGANATPGSTVNILGAGATLGTASAGADGNFAVPIRLSPGDNTVTAQATDSLGNRSRPSAPITVQYEPPPSVGISLSLVTVSGSDVALAYAVAGDASTVGSFQVIRTTAGADLVVGTTTTADRTFTDPNAPNGTHTYRVRAISPSGIVGSTSNSVVASIAAPIPVSPVLAIRIPPEGGRLDLSWSFPGIARFRLERATGDGAFAAFGITDALGVVDSSVTNGVLYRYRLFAIDAAGNESPPSNVVSGLLQDHVAPDRPVILQPTLAGTPWTTSTPGLTVSGLAELNSRVELTQNARYAGTATADQAMTAALPVSTAYPPAYRLDIAKAGEPMAYGYFDEHRAIRVAVEWPSQKRAVTFAVPGLFGEGPYLSPDAKHVAFLVYDSSYRLSVQIGDVENGTLSPLLASDPGGESSLSWSPDSTRIAYLATRGTTSIVVADLGTGTEIAHAVGAGGASRSGWISNGALGFIGSYGSSLVRLDLGTGVRQVIATAPFQVKDWSATSDGAHVAALLTDYSYNTKAYLIEGDAIAGPFSQYVDTPVFSSDGSRLAFLADGDLVTIDVTTKSLTVLGSVERQSELVWPETGLYGFSGWTGAVGRFVSGGKFEIPVSLGAGPNVFIAAATDAGGNRSGSSDPIEVDLDVSARADLAVSARVQPAVPVVGDAVQAIVTITNRGPIGVQGATVSATLTASDGTLRAASPVAVRALAAGESTVAIISLDATGLSGAQTLVVTADLLNGQADADLANNQAQVPFVIGASGTVSLTLEAQPRLVPADGVVMAHITLTNPGSPIGGVLSVALVDAGGVPAARPPDQAVTAAGATTTLVIVPLNVGRALAGAYQLAASFVGGAQRAASSLEVTIAPSTAVAVTALADRSSYFTGEAVQVDSFISNESLNTALDGATYRLVIEDGQGVVVASPSERAVPFLWMGGQVFISTTVSTLGLSPGSYTASVDVELGGRTVAHAASGFEIVGRPVLVGSVAVAGIGDPPAVPAGEPIPVTLAVANAGSLPSSSGVAHVITIDSRTGGEIARVDTAIAGIGPGATLTWSTGVAGGQPVGVYGLSLLVDHDGTSEILAVGRFRVVDAFAPALSVLGPGDGTFVSGNVLAQVVARDDSSGTAVVRAAADGLASSLTLQQGSVLDGIWTGTIHLPADGPHTLVFSAADAQGNDGLLSPGAANPVVVHVVSDTVAPSLSIQGITDGAVVNVPVSPILVAADANLARVDAQLNGSAFTPGTIILLDDDYILSAQATDRAGNSTVAGVRFAIDRTPPVIAVGGIFGGAYVSYDVTPVVVVTDPHLDSYSVILDGIRVAQGTTISAEGPHALLVDARDVAGNVAQYPVEFVIDKTPPLLALAGVDEGAVVRGPASISATATDANLAVFTVSLDGQPYQPGTPIVGEGLHTVVATASDKAGNVAIPLRRTFTIDSTPPAIQISGVQDGGVTNQDVLPVIEIRDANLDLSRTVETLDGVTLLPGTIVSAEGAHDVEVTAYDLAGNSTHASVRFEIDKSPPVISIDVVDGSDYGDPVAPTFSAADAHLASVSATLNGSAFASGSLVDAEGSYELVVTAKDLAGNISTEKVRFSITLVKYAIDKHLVARQPRVLVRLPCGENDARRMQQFFSAALPGTRLTFVQSQGDLLVHLRAGLHDVVLLTDGPGASATCAPTLPVPPIPAGRLEQEAEQELTEAAFRGVGIVVFRATQAAWPKLVEVLGLKFLGNELGGDVTITASAISGGIQLSVPDGVQLQPGAASPIGRFARDGGVAATVHGFGMGAAIAVGFDPSQASPTPDVSALVSGAVAFVTSESALVPRGVAAVEIAVTNEAKATTTRVRETLDPSLQVLTIGGAGQRLPSGEIEWSLQQAQGQSDRLDYLVRLPTQAGTFGTTTEVAAIRPSGVRIWGEYPLALVLGEGASDLAATAERLATALPDQGADRANRATILADLAAVQANPGATPADREQAISSLLSAVAAAKALQTVDPSALRLALDGLLAYWETRP